MSEPKHPKVRVRAPRRRRLVKLEAVRELEDRKLLAPYLPTNALTPMFTSDTGQPTATTSTGSVSLTTGPALADSAAGFTSVAQTTPISSFGGNIVRIEAGPGGDFGKGIYAITRGAGDNASVPGVVSRPGVIYRVDPATGKASIFFDLNTVINQLEPGNDASNGLLPATGFLNWYDITFDPEGYFDGRPSMFVSSVDQSDTNKNVVYRIGSDGTLLSVYTKFVPGANGAIDKAPTAILVPPTEQQTFLRGLFTGDGIGNSANNGTTQGGFAVLFFDANVFRPGQSVGATLPPGVIATPMTFGPQTAIVSSNTDYRSQVYSTFTDFGVPAAGGLPGQPGLSGVQGLGGEFPINGPIVTGFTDPNAATPDTAAAITTPFRRFEDAAFDYYGYFSYGATVTPGVGGAGATVTAPTFVGSLFVADLATGLAVTIPNPTNVTAGTITVPVQGPGPAGVTVDASGNITQLQLPGGNLGGRIVRIGTDGLVHTFAAGFRTSGSYFSDSFENSSLSITFSADGTTLYAADDDGIWQFKTVTSLANSTSGQLIGLNDLRTFGVPYEGQDTAVAIVDSGVDATTPNFRGRVAPGRNFFTNGQAGFGNQDTAPVDPNGHGTLVAGVVAQFVPQATLQPVNVFSTLIRSTTLTSGSGTVTVTPTGDTTPELVYNGLSYTADNPFVKDPVRPNAVSRVTTATLGFGTVDTYDVEGSLYKKAPQLTVAYKNQMARLRHLGIAPVAAAGQLGAPVQGSDALVWPNALGLGNTRGVAMPAVLNEAISVTGTYPFPFTNSAMNPPTDQFGGFFAQAPGPVLLTGGTGAITSPNLLPLIAADVTIFKDKVLSSSNRNALIDYAAPELDVPTFRRSFAGDGDSHLVFDEGGTSLSAGIVSGSFDVIASAISYWTKINQAGVTADGYLTTPAGVNQLNFGANQLIDLSSFANPDGINSILQWTAVPATDDANVYGDAIPLTDANANFVNTPFLIGTTQYRNFSRIDIGNAVAAIEGSIALNYLFAHNLMGLLDANSDGLLTAQEIQDFQDKATAIGLPEAGAMARFLGGNGRTGNANTLQPGEGLDVPPGGISAAPSGQTLAGETPDAPDALQRRFNFLDYAANGRLAGVVSIEQLRLLAHTLLPPADSFVTVDRQRSSATRYLLAPSTPRDYQDLQHLKPTFVWVPKSAVKRFRGISPNAFHINRGRNPFAQLPFFTLYQINKQAAQNAGGNGSNAPAGGGNALGGGNNGHAVGSNQGGGTGQGGPSGQKPTTPQKPTQAPATPTAPANTPANTSPLLGGAAANNPLSLLQLAAQNAGGTGAAGQAPSLATNGGGKTQLDQTSLLQASAPPPAVTPTTNAVPAGTIGATLDPSGGATGTTAAGATTTGKAKARPAPKQSRNFFEKIGDTVDGWFGK